MKTGLLIGGSAALLLLTACMGGTAAPDKDAAAGWDPDAAVEITWWTGQTEEAEKVAERLAAEYHAAHPNVTIRTSSGAPTTDDLLTKLSAGFTGGNYPDISYAYGSWAGDLGAGGKTQDLTSYVQDPSFKWEEMPAAARQVATADGKVIGVPALVDNIALLYNPALFDKAGVAYPTDQWSWEDFRSAARKLTDPASNTYGTAYSVSGSEDTTWHLWPLLWQNGGQILDGNKPAFNSDAGVKALETLRQMAVDDKSMYLDQTDERYWRLFNSGRIAMMMSGPWSMLDAKEAKLNYAVVNLPGVDGDHQTVSGPDLWVLFDHADANRAGAARAFITWLTSSAVDVRWNLAVGNLPLRSTEKDTGEFAAYVKEYPGGQKFFDNLANAKQARPTVPGYEELSRNVGDAIAAVLQGRAQPKAALDAAAKKSESALVN
ncbi:ABC transporter substrate-binding protein [Actinoplanes regularis]|uniref:Carbohydrate ABC transporter substrate-binding protein, CUT1 family n=1 Tax=Actinoplanes regularis TaxID=52697 RepID=A0A238YFG8_9ACTN|nr:ABC transporter substrate-binding protein [Actinoplanes regularis]GIE85962.1 ABC transporter substrate-binding protein [Actinoplanes regularis]SNR69343.1 carbohydrate ABC transporter substrate-binding protein, CUT1 family [Actinoplanes regularis]